MPPTELPAISTIALDPCDCSSVRRDIATIHKLQPGHWQGDGEIIRVAVARLLADIACRRKETP